MSENRDTNVIEAFGREWSTYDQADADGEELEAIFADYFELFPWADLPEGSVGFDLGCGSGRWARFVAPRVRTLHCVEPSAAALQVAQRQLAGLPNCRFHLAGCEDMPFPAASMDFGYALGVLHHVPDTKRAIYDCVQKLKPGAPFLIYLYYSFENRPQWYRTVWRGSDLLRRAISALPFPFRLAMSLIIAFALYLPAARTARLLDKLGMDVENLPLAAYRHRSFYTMRTDALDRFGTSLERRFTKAEIREMMLQAGLERISFSSRVYWTALGYRRND